jgi:hypothetical protein
MFISNYNRLLAVEEELFKQRKAVKHRKNYKSQKNIKTQTYLSDSNRLLALEEELISQRRNSKIEYQIKENKKYHRMAKMLNYENSANNKILALQQSLSKETVNKQKHRKRDRTKSKTQKTQAMTFDYNEAIELEYRGDSFAASLDYTTTEQSDLDYDISTIEVESFEVKEDNQTPEAVIPEVLPAAPEETESEQAADAEAFEADIQAILSGAKTYEPKQQKTSDTSSLSQAKSTQTNNNQPQENTPTKQTPSPQPQKENPHAIFDKIAQNMAYANSFDLGTISLEQRFDEFDDLLDAQESKALTVKSSPAIKENDLVELNYADFEHDLALMSEAIPEIDSVQIEKNAVYLPVEDNELREVAKNAIYSLPNMHPEILTGKLQPLAKLSTNAKLYLILHGHSQLPRFVVNGDDGGSNKGSFTAAELAEWIERDGLRKDHRELELLVCHAGQSVGTKQIVKKREAMQAKWKKIEASNKTSQKKAALKQQLEDEFEALSGQPSEFTKPDQWLPLAAEFVDELKKRKYTNIRVIAYKGAVRQRFGEQNPYDFPLSHYDDTKTGKQWGGGQVWVEINNKEYSEEKYKKEYEEELKVEWL